MSGVEAGGIGRRSPATSQADDDHGRVIGGGAEVDEFIRQCLDLTVAVASETVGEALQALVDVLPAALDQPVGVQDEGGAVGVGGGGLGPGVCSRLAPNGGSVAWSRKRTVPSGSARAGGGWPALL